MLFVTITSLLTKPGREMIREIKNMLTLYMSKINLDSAIVIQHIQHIQHPCICV